MASLDGKDERPNADPDVAGNHLHWQAAPTSPCEIVISRRYGD